MMMSTVTPYTLLSRPAPSGKISRMPLQPRKQAAAPAAAAAVALPWVRSKLSPLSVCHASHTYDVPPFALVHPKFSPTESKNDWKITEDADHINLWFKVEEETNKDELEVATNGNVLLIRYKQKGKTENPAARTSPASSLDVRLLMPSGYDDPKKSKVEAELTFGSLLVTVSKPEQNSNPIRITTSD